jgi:spore coat polysaccharide biosynthesis protein SpsF
MAQGADIVKIVIISQARMASTRLPGKVMRKVLGKPLLQHQIERLRSVPVASNVVIATSENELDDVIVNLCNRLGCTVCRGSEDDVLGRYYHAAKSQNADVVVRVTSDCPLIDPLVVEQVSKFYLRHVNEYDFVSNTVKRTYPRGMDTEVFSMRVLEEAFREARLEYEREHVTPFIYTRPERYRIGNVTYHTDASQHRWTVDTFEDFELLRRIMEAFGSKNTRFTLEDTIHLLKQHPEWAVINSHVEQKKFDSEGQTE